MSRGTEPTDNPEGALVQINANVDQVVEKLTGGLLEEVFGMGKDWLRAQRLRLLTDRLEGAAEMCQEAGIDNPEQVALSTLAPWIEGASVEDDPTLHEMWESLLANAGDPQEGRSYSHRSFVRILKHIEAPERKVLEVLYRMNESDEERVPYPDAEKIQTEIAESELGVVPSVSRLNLAKINLVRLGLCSRGGRLGIGGGGFGGGGGTREEPQEGPERVHISDFGRAFYKACQPPESKSDM